MMLITTALLERHPHLNGTFPQAGLNGILQTSRMKISNIVVGRRRGLGFPGLFDFKWFDGHFRILAIALLIGSQLASCSDSFDARANLSDTEYQNYLRLLAPYIHKKPDGLSFTERFHKKAEAYL